MKRHGPLPVSPRHTKRPRPTTARVSKNPGESEDSDVITSKHLREMVSSMDRLSNLDETTNGSCSVLQGLKQIRNTIVDLGKFADASMGQLNVFLWAEQGQGKSFLVNDFVTANDPFFEELIQSSDSNASYTRYCVGYQYSEECELFYGRPRLSDSETEDDESDEEEDHEETGLTASVAARLKARRGKLV